MINHAFESDEPQADKKHIELPISEKHAPQIEVLEIKVYRRRWLVLLIFVFFTSIYNMQAAQFIIVENVMTRYYGVSSISIEWTSMIFSVLYVVLFIPSSYLLHKMDLRFCCVTAAVATCIGTWLKVIAVRPDRFYLAFTGQTIAAAWLLIILATPVSLSAYWFGPNEVATATAMASFGMALGMAFFLFFVPMAIRNHENLDDIGNDIYYLTMGLAIASTIAAVGMILFFRNEPPLPPSQSRALKKQKTEEFQFIAPLRRILKNKNFILLWNAHGLNNGVLNAVATTLNPVCLSHFKDGERHVGTIAFSLVVIGTIGACFFGWVQDKTKKFKELLVYLYTCSWLAHGLFAFALYMESIWAVYLTSALYGLFIFSYMSTGYETCVEITYPEPEPVCMAVLNAANQIYGFILIVIINDLMHTYNDTIAYVILSVVIAIGLVITLFTDDVQNRQAAMKSVNDNARTA